MCTLSTCPSCEKAKRFFTERRIPFQFANYDLAVQATQHKIMIELEAEELQAFLVVRIGDEIVPGYDPKRNAKDDRVFVRFTTTLGTQLAVEV